MAGAAALVHAPRPVSSTERARPVAGSRQGFARAAVALLLAALGLALPTARALHASHEHARASASVVEAACPDGCVDPSHHHQGDELCVLCAAHASPSLPGLARLAAPRPVAIAVGSAPAGRSSSGIADCSAPRGPPSSIVA